MNRTNLPVCDQRSHVLETPLCNRTRSLVQASHWFPRFGFWRFPLIKSIGQSAEMMLARGCDAVGYALLRLASHRHRDILRCCLLWLNDQGVCFPLRYQRIKPKIDNMGIQEVFESPGDYRPSRTITSTSTEQVDIGSSWKIFFLGPVCVTSPQLAGASNRRTCPARALQNDLAVPVPCLSLDITPWRRRKNS